MGKNFPRPTGQLQGDDQALPDRGTGTGLNGDTYGADISQSAINRQGGIKSATKSHEHQAQPGSNNMKGC